MNFGEFLDSVVPYVFLYGRSLATTKLLSMQEASNLRTKKDVNKALIEDVKISDLGFFKIQHNLHVICGEYNANIIISCGKNKFFFLPNWRPTWAESCSKSTHKNCPHNKCHSLPSSLCRRSVRQRIEKMPLKLSDATTSSFDDVFEKFRSEASNNKANLILFLADNDPATSRSWCPDCVRAEPVIYKKLEASSDDIALLKAYVGDRPTWRNPQHPWRVDPRFKLTGVPTLIRWENDTVKGRLEDHEAPIEKKIEALIA